jgi:hypothetical protein
MGHSMRIVVATLAMVIGMAFSFAAGRIWQPLLGDPNCVAIPAPPGELSNRVIYAIPPRGKCAVRLTSLNDWPQEAAVIVNRAGEPPTVHGPF